MPVSDAAFGEIVRRHLDGDAITRQNADPVAAKFARQMSKDNAFRIQLNTKLTGRELLNHGSRYFDAILFAH